ncbi:MAG: glycosyltransferase family protein [Candidatus Pacebacteria bacterium]|nr:glycosyltransferase family protein [Candidatus Paceibacterota bacterium]
MEKVICIIQARTGSTRLSNKIFLPLQGKPVLLRVIERVFQSKYISGVVVATTVNPNDEKIVELLKNYDSRVSVYRGSEEDVLDRYYQAAKGVGADIVVRITSDNPCVDPDVIDKIIGEVLADPELEYASNNIGEHTYPRGLDTEVIRFKTLEKLWKTTTEKIDREHVTIHLKRFPDNFKWKTVLNDIDLSSYRLTVDVDKDYELVKTIYDRLYPVNPKFRLEDIMDLFKKEPELIKINQDIEQQNAKY